MARLGPAVTLKSGAPENKVSSCSWPSVSTFSAAADSGAGVASGVGSVWDSSTAGDCSSFELAGLLVVSMGFSTAAGVGADIVLLVIGIFS